MSRRLQLYFEDEQYRTLKTLARKRKRPMAVLVRAAVDDYLARADPPETLVYDPIFSLVGMVEGPAQSTNLAEEHDEILYGSGT